MAQVSVVIITKNEARNIADCILSAKKISNDIIVIDSGSTDETAALAKTENVKLRSIVWKGYGHSRNTGAMLAVNDWIFSLDADERITDELAASIAGLTLSHKHVIYGFKRLNYFYDKKIRFGALAHDRVFRLYNRCHSQWNLVPVHEKLTGANAKRIIVKDHLVHYAVRSVAIYQQKNMGYAVLCALKYQQEKKRFIHARSMFSPFFNFVKAYIFQLGFLDKQRGFILAKINALYTRKKYRQLMVLMNKGKSQEERPAFLQNYRRKISSFLS